MGVACIAATVLLFWRFHQQDVVGTIKINTTDGQSLTFQFVSEGHSVVDTQNKKSLQTLPLESISLRESRGENQWTGLSIRSNTDLIKILGTIRENGECEFELESTISVFVATKWKPISVSGNGPYKLQNNGIQVGAGKYVITTEGPS